MAPAILGYWELRGLAQPIRLLLEYTGQAWEEKIYKSGPPPDYNPSAWLVEKETLGLDFPNLPYYFDGNVKLTQSSAIIRYIARKHKLDGATEEEKQRVDQIEGETGDMKGAFAGMCYNPNFAAMKDGYLQGLPVKLQRLSKFLGNRPYFAGDNLTYVDFIIYEVLDQHKFLYPDCLKEFGNLEQFLERIQNLEKIAAYMKSPRFIKYPINGPSATFGG